MYHALYQTGIWRRISSSIFDLGEGWGGGQIPRVRKIHHVYPVVGVWAHDRYEHTHIHKSVSIAYLSAGNDEIDGDDTQQEGDGGGPRQAAGGGGSSTRARRPPFRVNRGSGSHDRGVEGRDPGAMPTPARTYGSSVRGPVASIPTGSDRGAGTRSRGGGPNQIVLALVTRCMRRRYYSP